MNRSIDPTFRRMAALVLVGSLVVPNGRAAAQDAHIMQPAAEIERQMRDGELEVLRVSPARGYPSERTYQITLQVDGGAVTQWQLAPAPGGGEEFNNKPHYELGAYALQKLFLDEPDYVVPPTGIRCFPLDWVESLIAMAPGNPNPVERTFRDWPMVVSVLQYWAQGAGPATRDDIEDDDRFAEDPLFAKHAANFNLLTYLIRHNDSNDGNYLISPDPANPRIFSIDNGVAFESQESDRGFHWRELRFDRFPAASIERLGALDLETLQRELGVLVQFELQGAEFVEVEPTENMDEDEGIRRTDSVIQIGLTGREIRNVHRRLVDLLEDIDDGRYEVFP